MRFRFKIFQSSEVETRCCNQVINHSKNDHFNFVVSFYYSVTLLLSLYSKNLISLSHFSRAGVLCNIGLLVIQANFQIVTGYTRLYQSFCVM